MSTPREQFTELWQAEAPRVQAFASRHVGADAAHDVVTNGKTRAFEIWRGTNEDGLICTAVLEAQGKFGPEFGGNCGNYPTDAWFDRTSESYKMGDAPPPPTYFVYGEHPHLRRLVLHPAGVRDPRLDLAIARMTRREPGGV